PPARSARSRTASSPAAAKKPRTSPRPPRPATCSPPCSIRCATGRPGPWPPRPRREQARTPAARDRPQVWPPPPGGAAAGLIDPTAGRRNAPCPADRQPAGTRRDDRSRAPAQTPTLHLGQPTTPYPVSPATASVAGIRTGLKVVRPAGRSTLTPAPIPACLKPPGNQEKKGTSSP